MLCNVRTQAEVRVIKDRLISHVGPDQMLEALMAMTGKGPPSKGAGDLLVRMALIAACEWFLGEEPKGLFREMLAGSLADPKPANNRPWDPRSDS